MFGLHSFIQNSNQLWFKSIDHTQSCFFSISLLQIWLLRMHFIINPNRTFCVKSKDCAMPCWSIVLSFMMIFSANDAPDFTYASYTMISLCAFFRFCTRCWQTLFVVTSKTLFGFAKQLFIHPHIYKQTKMIISI